MCVCLCGVVCLGRVSSHKNVLSTFRVIKMSLITCRELGVVDPAGAYYHFSVIWDNRTH